MNQISTNTTARSLSCIGSVDDIRSSLRWNKDKFTIKYLNECLIDEAGSFKRTTVIRMIQRAMRQKWIKLSGKELLDNYPKLDMDRHIYVRYPIKKDGMWQAVNVHLPTGLTYLANPVCYLDESRCAQACDITNKIHGFSRAQVLEIVNESFKNANEKV